MKKWPKLYDKASTGRIKTWEILVDSLYGEVAIITKHGLLDGKITSSPKVIDKGKNIGKSNETTPYQQACKDAQSKFEKQKKKGYVEDVADIGKGFSYLPMLAKTFYQETHPDVVKGKKKKTVLSSPLIVQPKLNGVRCIAHREASGEVKLYSREGNEFENLSHIANDLLLIMQVNDVWDGEVYNHDLGFQEIIRRVKKYRPGETEELQYHWYDIADESLTMMDRKWRMKNITVFNSIHKVETRVTNQDSLKATHDAYVKQGYEGLIIRLPDAKYRFKYRGKNLWKYKDFTDAEFKIIGYRQGTGSDTGTIKFLCKSNADHLSLASRYFTVRPRGSVKRRKAMYLKGWKYVGKMYTVRYQELSEEEKPIFPVGIEFRDYE